MHWCRIKAVASCNHFPLHKVLATTQLFHKNPRWIVFSLTPGSLRVHIRRIPRNVQNCFMPLAQDSCHFRTEKNDNCRKITFTRLDKWIVSSEQSYDHKLTVLVSYMHAKHIIMRNSKEHEQQKSETAKPKRFHWMPYTSLCLYRYGNTREHASHDYPDVQSKKKST